MKQIMEKSFRGFETTQNASKAKRSKSEPYIFLQEILVKVTYRGF